MCPDIFHAKYIWNVPNDSGSCNGSKRHGKKGFRLRYKTKGIEV